jgi:hypothetical protein
MEQALSVFAAVADQALLSLKELIHGSFSPLRRVFTWPA